MPKQKIAWDKIGEHTYELGVDHGILAILGDDGVYGTPEPWNGLTNVSEDPSGAEASPSYADNIKYLNIISAEDFGLSIEGFTYPAAFGECDGSAEVAPGVFIGQQARKTFAFGYRTKVGNDIQNENYGYKLHFAYGCLASPSEKSFDTISDNPEPMTLSWDITTTPVSVTGYKPTAFLTVDSTLVDPDKLAALEELIYGKDPTTEDADDGVAPHFPMPDEIIALMTA